MKPPIHVVPAAHTPHDLIEILQGLLETAQSGDITGMIFGIGFRDQRYYCDAAGSLHRNRVLALGVANMLCADLERSIRTTEETIF